MMLVVVLLIVAIVFSVGSVIINLSLSDMEPISNVGNSAIEDLGGDTDGNVNLIVDSGGGG